MKLSIFICLIFLSSCIIRPGYYSSYTSTYIPNTTTIITPTPFLFTPAYPIRTWTPSWSLRPRTYGLGNVYNHHHHYHSGGFRPRTNLPLQNGPIGGRRK